MSTTRKSDSTVQEAVLYMALELSEKTWKLGFSTGLGQEPRQRDIPARAVVRLEQEILAAKERFGLPPETPVASCYEAGRDGFWLHRCLLSLGVANEVVDSSSIEIDRRKRRAARPLSNSTKVGDMVGIEWQSKRRLPPVSRNQPMAPDRPSLRTRRWRHLSFTPRLAPPPRASRAATGSPDRGTRNSAEPGRSSWWRSSTGSRTGTIRTCQRPG